MNAFQTTIAIAIASSAATAGVVDMKFNGTGAGSTVQIQLGESNAFNVFAGELKHEITNASGVDTYLNGNHRTFCADITEHVSSDFVQYQTADLESIPLTTNNPNPMSSTQADAIRALYAQNATALIAGGLSNAFGTAMQLTVWELITDFDGSANSIDITTGDFLAAGRNGDTLDIDILNHIEGLKTQVMFGINNGQAGPEMVAGLASAGAQDQLVVVPAPGAFALLAAGALMTTRRRKN